MKKLYFIVLVFFLIFSSTGCAYVEIDSSTTGNISSGELRVFYFDVGQGDSIYIRTPNGDDILIDAGDNHYGDEVVNYLKELEVDDIEVLIATHPHSDHIGGLDVVLDNFVVESVYAPRVSHTTKSYEDFLLAVADQGIKIKTAKAGVELPLDGVSAKFIGPAAEYDDLNNWSAALHLVYGDTSFIFAGDAEEHAELDILANNRNIQADVYKVGHHGSNSSSSDEFLSAVNPEYAVISVGTDNRYGHPHKEALDKFIDLGIKVLRTDLDGTILFTSDGSSIEYSTIQDSKFKWTSSANAEHRYY